MRRYEIALTYLETIHRNLGVDEFQAGFMDDKLEVYEAAARLLLLAKRKRWASWLLTTWSEKGWGAP